MDILKLLPPRNTISEKIIYRLNGVVNLIGLCHGFHVDNTRSKNVEPHLGSSYAIWSTFRLSLQRHHVLVHGSFLCQAPSNEWNSFSVCAMQSNTR